MCFLQRLGPLFNILVNVGDREAAMLMAIVANKLGKPLNTLRFKSMKEVI